MSRRKHPRAYEPRGVPSLLRKGGSHRDRTKYHRPTEPRERDMLDGIQTGDDEMQTYEDGLRRGVTLGVTIMLMRSVHDNKLDDSTTIEKTLEALADPACPGIPQSFLDALVAKERERRNAKH